ncbi:OadG-related small transporter subunit [Acetivibrio sp. MSJd-27]|nr:OadG-related small transporter subunit [Acetivibrio sp. MSJd-27]
MNIQALLHSLPIMGKGMLGIFIVILVIYVCIKLLNKLFPAKSE